MQSDKTADFKEVRILGGHVLSGNREDRVRPLRKNPTHDDPTQSLHRPGRGLPLQDTGQPASR